MRPLLFLLKLAWDCRYRLPILITVGFMVLDVRMQLDINVQTRRIPRIRRPPPVIQIHEVDEEAEQNDIPDHVSNDSWSTVDEYDVPDLDLCA